VLDEASQSDNFEPFSVAFKRRIGRAVITGFNTDVEHDGVVYHVQTEDKGLDSPLILSLVYTGGAILASKRAPYDDLIKSGFNERVLIERLQRQHKLICAAIRAGRIEDLKRMSTRDSATRAPSTSPTEVAPPQTGKESSVKEAAASKTQPVSAPVVAPGATPVGVAGTKSEGLPPRTAPPTVRAITQDMVADFARATAATSDALHVSLLDEREFRGGERVALRIRVSRGAGGKEAIPAADVTVKVLGSTFRPLIFTARTGPDGVAFVRAELPHFKTGRAAILIRVVANGYEAELRRIVQQG
jgi:hypothetical protein